MYFNSLDENRQASLAYENQIVQQLLQQLQGMEQYFTRQDTIPTLENRSPIINAEAPQTDTQVQRKTR
jgi:hypothetical protein